MISMGKQDAQTSYLSLYNQPDMHVTEPRMRLYVFGWLTEGIQCYYEANKLAKYAEILQDWSELRVKFKKSDTICLLPDLLVSWRL